MKGYQIEHPPFLFYTLFNGSEQFVLLILILCPDIWGGNLATDYSFFHSQIPIPES